MKKGIFAAALALTLLGAAPAQATLTWSPATFDFGDQEFGNASPAVTFTLTATCTTPGPMATCLDPAAGEYVIGDVAAPGDEFGIETDTCGLTIAAPVTGSATCTARVTFKPTSLGAKAGTLTTNGPAIAVATLTGTGVEEKKKNDGSGGKKCSKKKKGKKNNSATAAKKKKGCKKKGKKGK